MSESSCYGLQQRSEQCRDSGGVPRGESGLAHHTWPSGKVGAPAVPVSSLHASRFRRSTLVVHRSSGIKMFLFLEICAASKSSLVHDLKKTKKNNPSLSRIFLCPVWKSSLCVCAWRWNIINSLFWNLCHPDCLCLPCRTNRISARPSVTPPRPLLYIAPTLWERLLRASPPHCEQISCPLSRCTRHRGTATMEGNKNTGACTQSMSRNP